ncbi:flavodoxin family protein, partial [[Eubacterium] cellulosolvens]
FAPGSEVEIENTEMELSGYSAVLLGFPKWTFSCPPLNRFIRKLRSVSSPKFFLFMTCGGFDDQRFLRSMTRRLAKIGCDVVESLTVRRKQIRTEAYGASVDSFAKRIDEHMH